MEVVYLFCESGVVRIPFFHYDRSLFRLLVSQGGGFWDNARREFVFKGNTSAERFNRVLSDIPCVWVEENSPAPLRVFGFLERPWEKAVNLPYEKAGLPVDDPSPSNLTFVMLSPLPLPEKFSELWQMKLEAELRARKYSPRTLRSYVYYNRLLCRTLQKSPEEIQPEDITKFLARMEKDREYSASSINLAISATKFFYKRILKKDISKEHQRPRHDKRLPVVLSKDEISKILNMEKNPKHCLLLMLAYSSGLRVSEVVALKREHIDLSRKVIYVRLGKGRKDRCTLLSEKAARFIREYNGYYDIQTWLFPGQPSSRHLTIRSAQKIFENAILRTDISKNASIHSLRHTFATHLLENGTGIRYIQALLGHSSIRTTERYTHIAQGNILNIQSPLDSI